MYPDLKTINIIVGGHSTSPNLMHLIPLVLAQLPRTTPLVTSDRTPQSCRISVNQILMEIKCEIIARRQYRRFRRNLNLASGLQQIKASCRAQTNSLERRACTIIWKNGRFFHHLVEAQIGCGVLVSATGAKDCWRLACTDSFS